MRCTLLCVVELESSLSGSCFQVVTGLSTSDHAASYRPCTALPRHGLPHPAKPCQVALSHRNGLSVKGHYADQQPVPHPTKPRIAPPQLSVPSGAFAPQYRLLPIGITLFTALAKPWRALPRRTLPCRTAWYSVPESTLYEGTDRYVVAPARPNRAEPCPAVPSTALSDYRHR